MITVPLSSLSRHYGRWTYKYEIAAEKGAAAQVANGDKYPEWNPGTEFKAKRDEMLKKK